MNLNNYLALTLVLLSSLLSDASSRFRIVKGNYSSIEDRNYMVSLFYFWKYFCAGSVVDLETVITAAHCVINREARYIDVKAGVHDIRERGHIHNMQCVIIPPTYDEETSHMDIAAIKVNPPFIESSAIKPIPLCHTELKPYTKMRFSGWGVTCAGSTKPSEVLQTTFQYIMAMEDCAFSYKPIRSLTSSMICGGLTERDTCNGDSGAPGVVNGQMCAVVSGGIGCGNRRYPGIYTNLNNAQVLKFVKDLMKPTPVEKERRSRTNKLFAYLKKRKHA